jgi:hypothetical protein
MNELTTSTKCWIISTRKNRSKKNFFWRTWINAGLGKNNFKQFTIRIKDVNYLDQLRLASIRKTISRAHYDNEFTIRTK